jgi:hypothetical protein
LLDSLLHRGYVLGYPKTENATLKTSPSKNQTNQPKPNQNNNKKTNKQQKNKKTVSSQQSQTIKQMVT